MVERHAISTPSELQQHPCRVFTRVLPYVPGMRQVHVKSAIDIQEKMTTDAAKSIDELTNAYVQHGCRAAGKFKIVIRFAFV